MTRTFLPNRVNTPVAALEQLGNYLTPGDSGAPWVLTPEENAFLRGNHSEWPTSADRLTAFSSIFLGMAGVGGDMRVIRFPATRLPDMMEHLESHGTFDGETTVGVCRVGVHAGDIERALGSTAFWVEGAWSASAHGQWENREPRNDADSGLQFTPLDGWGAGFTEVRPSEELLEGLPAALRAAAVRTVPSTMTAARVVLVVDDDENPMLVMESPELDFTAEQIISDARNLWRAAVTARIRSIGGDSAEDEASRARHREKTRRNWSAFVQSRPKVEEHLVGTLPFVPHGLASSRRWGIEVESGGARGVQCPPDWNVHGDGSLRSAYDGYVARQDFEPYDEERQVNTNWIDCEHSERHNPRVEVYDSERGEYVYQIREDWIDPRGCESCGVRMETVRVEPQTITHYARSEDCREFVSPILTSMHSNGLESLCEALVKNPQNSSAGIHVHVEADDLSAKQIATLVYGYGLLEPILESSYRRERRDFCNPRTAEDLLVAGRVASRGGEYPQGNAPRYVTVNTNSLNVHGTIEFRAMGPVYEYEYLTRWAMLCRELVNVVAGGATNRDFAKVKSWQDLLNLLTMFGKEYVRASVYELTGEVGEVAKLEKAGEPVTTAALNADLDSAFETLRSAFRRLGTSSQTLASRLVTVGGTSET